MGVSFGDMMDTVEPLLDPASLAYAHGERRIYWGEASKRSNRLARAFRAAGAASGDKCAHYMRNSPAYMETLAAGFKASITHVNVNYRYTPDEVHYIFDNSDAAVVVYDAEFRPAILTLKDRLPKVKLFVEVGGGADRAPFAADFETLASDGDGTPLGIERSPDDMFFLYTGGTTGMPKGVMWRHADLRETQLMAARRLGLPAPESLEELQHLIRTRTLPPAVICPACPLMHGTGLLTSLSVMLSGGTVVTLTAHSLDAHELWAAVERHRVTQMAIVGDAFAKPMLRALDEAPGRYDLSSLVQIVSSGVMWSVEVKRGLLAHLPGAAMTDSFGASEAVGFGSSIMTKDGEIQTARFQIGERCKVFDEDGVPVEPGSGKSGVIAMPPPIPMGYYKDEAKTAATFRTIGGVRYSMPGDWCIVEADGSLTLLGRGSVSINTGGEKVYPEEVEEALKTHADVDDALVVGVPDEKWGQAVTAVVKLAQGATLNEDALRAHVRQALAPYKAPKRIIAGDVALRAPNGKADYKAAQSFAKSALGLQA